MTFLSRKTEKEVYVVTGERSKIGQSFAHAIRYFVNVLDYVKIRLSCYRKVSVTRVSNCTMYSLHSLDCAFHGERIRLLRAHVA